MKVTARATLGIKVENERLEQGCSHLQYLSRKHHNLGFRKRVFHTHMTLQQF